MRWWNVHRISPSGMEFNYVWYIRQFMYAMIPPTAAFITMEFVSYVRRSYPNNVQIEFVCLLVISMITCFT